MASLLQITIKLLYITAAQKNYYKLRHLMEFLQVTSEGHNKLRRYRKLRRNMLNRWPAIITRLNYLLHAFFL